MRKKKGLEGDQKGKREGILSPKRKGRGENRRMKTPGDLFRAKKTTKALTRFTNLLTRFLLARKTTKKEERKKTKKKTNQIKKK